MQVGEREAGQEQIVPLTPTRGLYTTRTLVTSSGGFACGLRGVLALLPAPCWWSGTVVLLPRFVVFHIRPFQPLFK